MEYALLLQRAGPACIAGRKTEGYGLYCEVIEKILKAKRTEDTTKIQGIPVREMFLHALHAVAAAVSQEDASPQLIEQRLVPVLERVATELYNTASYDALILSNYGLARRAFDCGKRQSSADYNVTVVKAGLSAKEKSVTLGAYAKEKLQSSKDNLAHMRAEPGSIEKMLTGAALVGGVGGHAVGKTTSTPAIRKSLCASCGKDFAANKCSVCQSVVYCDKECQRAHWKPVHKAMCAPRPT